MRNRKCQMHPFIWLHCQSNFLISFIRKYFKKFLFRLPRESQPVVRSSSDSAWKNYITVSDNPIRRSFDFGYSNDYVRTYLNPHDPYGTIKAKIETENDIMNEPLSPPPKPKRVHQNKLNGEEESEESDTDNNSERYNENEVDKENLYNIII